MKNMKIQSLFCINKHLSFSFSRFLVKEQKLHDELPKKSRIGGAELSSKWVLSKHAVTRGTSGHVAVLAC